MDQAQAYIDAQRKFSEISSEIKAVVKIMTTVSDALERAPGIFCFSNTGKGLPAEATMSRNSVSVDARFWPSVDRIMDMLAQWHEARDAVKAAWNAIPKADRSFLKEPIL